MSAADRPDASPIVDAEVHITWKKAEELLPSLPRVWHDRFLLGTGHTTAGMRIQPNYYTPFQGQNTPRAAVPADGPAGSDPALLARDWLDRHNIAGAVLSHEEGPVISTWGDTVYPQALAVAYNDWLVANWLARDARFLGSMLVATQDPVAAAREIERVGEHERVVQVLLPSGTRLPYGSPYYHPIYAAAERRGVQIAIHTGTEGSATSNPPTAVGWPSTYMEWHAAQAFNLAAHLTSLLTEGVFVAFPRLRFIFLDGGAAWLAPLLWRLDKNYKGLRVECPWLTELPSVAIPRHCRFGTHAIERGNDDGLLWRLLDEIDGEQTLLWASNYPRWDCEAPADCAFLTRAAQDARLRILGGNAAALYGLSARERQEAAMAATSD